MHHGAILAGGDKGWHRGVLRAEGDKCMHRGDLWAEGGKTPTRLPMSGLPVCDVVQASCCWDGRAVHGGQAGEAGEG